jgi:hypothetical protein
VLESITHPCGPLLTPSAAPPHSPAPQPDVPAAGGTKLAASSTHPASPPQAPSTQHLHVASAVLACGRSFAADALAATAPELLVFLVKHCAAARSQGMTTLLRGYHGRPGATTSSGGEEAGHHHKSCVDEDGSEALDGLDPLDSALEWFGSGVWGVSEADVLSGTLMGEDTTTNEDRRLPPGAGGLSRAGSVQPGGGGGANGMAVALKGALTAPLPPPRWVDVALDRRLALLLALMARCALDPDAFARYGLQGPSVLCIPACHRVTCQHMQPLHLAQGVACYTVHHVVSPLQLGLTIQDKDCQIQH